MAVVNMGERPGLSKLPISNVAVASVGCVAFGLFAFGLHSGAAAILLGFVAKFGIDRGRVRGLRLALAGIWGGAVSCGLYLFLLATAAKAPPPPVPSPAAPPPPVVVAPPGTWPGLIDKTFDRLDHWWSGGKPKE